ncbi:MAG: hypothetical protein ACKVVP_23455 [Chloroflexota bacterium]
MHVVAVPVEDSWRAYIRDLESRGAATLCHSRDEALRNIPANEDDEVQSE